MKPSIIQSLALLVAVLVYVSAVPQTYVVRTYNHDKITLPPKVPHQQPFNTVSPVTKPMQKTMDTTSNTSSEDTDSAMQDSSSDKDSVPTRNPSGVAPSANATGQKSPSKLAAPSRRMKKTSVTGVPPNTAEEKSTTRPRAMTLPR